MVVVVGIDPTSSAYEAGAHPSTPYNLNCLGYPTRIELVIAESQPAVLPLNYRHHIETHYPRLTTLARALLKSDTACNVFLYGRGTENRTLINRVKAYYFDR